MAVKGPLNGKSALVTGGSRGIGKAISMRLAELGADVAINYQYTAEQAKKLSGMIDQIGILDELKFLAPRVAQMNTKEDAKAVSDSIDKIGRQSIICRADVSDFDQVEAMKKQIYNEFGKLDILVNNAGIIRDKSFVRMTPQMWRDVLSVNLDGIFYTTKAFIDGMLANKYGRIVNISSVIGQMGNKGQANYAAAKAGMIAVTKTLAKEFAGKGVTVNAVAPGFIATEMVSSLPQEMLDKVISQIPLGRLGKPSGIAGAVAYLVSDDGDYITGQVLSVNGGLYI